MIFCKQFSSTFETKMKQLRRVSVSLIFAFLLVRFAFASHKRKKGRKAKKRRLGGTKKAHF